jgi:8-oxo-dGTP pyrophosphatase MutT (NUDIX family)
MEKYRILVKGIVQLEDKYLIVRRWFDDRVSEPYQWGFIDGNIEFGEAPEKAILRNVAEQAGLSVVLDRILYTWSFMTGDVFNIGISYLCQTTMADVLLSEELVESKWVTKEELETFIDHKIMEDLEAAEL